MLRSFSRTCLFSLAFSYFASLSLYAQDAVSPPPLADSKPTNLDYPDSTRGLERLAKDIIKAQKEGQGPRASELAQSMILPDPSAWYSQTFGQEIAADEGAKYVSSYKTLPAEILKFFFGAIQNGFTEVTAARFTESCDDNAGESAFGTLQLRLQPVPLYELRLRNGDRFLRLFAMVYVDGGFRYALAPRVPDHFPFVLPHEGNSLKILRVGGTVQASKIVNRVQPEYPGIARDERLQGTVRLHAIIAKDGSISRLVVLSGYCSLAKASVDAVKKWRYTPTLLMGQPVEVDTTIDVIFSLNR